MWSWECTEMKMKKISILFCLLTSALISGAAITFFEYLGSLIWVGMIPLFAALSELCKKDGLKLRHAYAYGLFYFELFYSVCFHWFTELYPLDFTGLNNFTSILVVIIAWFGLSFLQALFGALTFVAFIAISRSSLFKKSTCDVYLHLPRNIFLLRIYPDSRLVGRALGQSSYRSCRKISERSFIISFGILFRYFSHSYRQLSYLYRDLCHQGR